MSTRRGLGLWGGSLPSRVQSATRTRGTKVLHRHLRFFIPYCMDLSGFVCTHANRVRARMPYIDLAYWGQFKRARSAERMRSVMECKLSMGTEDCPLFLGPGRIRVFVHV